MPNDFKQRNADIPIDIKHASQLKAPKGEAAHSAGWIKELKIENKAIWGRVQWNKMGEELVASKQLQARKPRDYLLINKPENSPAFKQRESPSNLLCIYKHSTQRTQKTKKKNKTIRSKKYVI